MTKEVEVIEGTAVEAFEEQPLPSNLFKSDNPLVIVERATKLADVLKDILKRQHLTSNIGGKDFVRLEGWSALATLLGIVPIIEWTRKLENGWEARAVAQTLDGRVVGAAEAQCTREEKSWGTRPDYALRAMAQTRSSSRALRGPLGFIVSLAGYETTAPEEIIDIEPISPLMPEEARQRMVMKIIESGRKVAEVFAEVGVDSAGPTIDQGYRIKAILEGAQAS